MGRKTNHTNNDKRQTKLAFLKFFMRYLYLFCILFLSYITHAQHIINGKISDLNTGEPLIGATILHADGEGTVSNYDGYFELRLKKGYTLLLLPMWGIKLIKKRFGLTEILN